MKRFFKSLPKLILHGFKRTLFFLMCGFKMLANFYKCAIFYLLDIVKYLLIYVPVMVILHIIGMHSEWKQMKPALDKGLQWPNGIQNDCYRCKNKRGKKISLRDRIKAIFEKKDVDDDSSFNFFFFLLIMFVGFGFFYTIYHLYSKNNLAFDDKGVSLNIMRDFWLYAVILCIVVTVIYYQPTILISSSSTPAPGQYSQ